MIERILAIRPRALGDVVLTTPALRALHLGYPAARLDVVTERPYGALLRGLPGIGRVWTLERSNRDTLGLVSRIRRERYDMVVDFFGNPRTALLTRGSGASLTAGYDLRGRAHAYTVRVPRSVPPAGGEREYAAAVHVRLALAVGGRFAGLETRVALSDAARAQATDVLARSGVERPWRCVGLVATATWATKLWPVSHAAVLARGLMRAGWEVLALVGPGEARVARVLERLSRGLRVLVPCDVATLAAVIARLAAVVGTDSGPRHLAAALEVPSFAWFGPTHPDTWNPPQPRHGFWRSDLPCRGCDRTECPHWNCMPALSAAHALERVSHHLEAHAGNPADLHSAAGA